MAACPSAHDTAPLVSVKTASPLVTCSQDWLLSFVTHVRYKEPDLLFSFPHRLLPAASREGGLAMTFEEILDQAIAMLQRRGRVTYQTLKLQFQLDEEHLEALKDAILFAHPQIIDEAGRGLVWIGAASAIPLSTPASPQPVEPPITSISRG